MEFLRPKTNKEKCIMENLANKMAMVISGIIIFTIFALGFVPQAKACAEDDTNGLFLEAKNGDFIQVAAIDIDKNYLAVVYIEESLELDVKWHHYPIETTKIFYSDSKGKLFRMHLDPDHMLIRTDHNEQLPMPIRIQVKLDE